MASAVLPVNPRGKVAILLALWFGWLVALPVAAAPLETPFFRWEVPQGWTVSRNPLGLWVLTAPGPNPLEAQVSVVRLSTSPEHYLKGTAALWKSLGEVEQRHPWVTDRENQAWFLVKHTPQPGQPQIATVKWVSWRGPMLAVVSYKAPLADMKSWAPKIRSMSLGLQLQRPQFDETRLREEIDTVLSETEDRRETLADLESIKLAMAVARQDWEPFFAADKPPVYRAYVAYLEARYDAAFAITNGSAMGMGPDVVDSRLQALGNRREELRREAQGF